MLACLPINAREALGRSSYGSGKAHGGGGIIILAVGAVLVLQRNLESAKRNALSDLWRRAGRSPTENHILDVECRPPLDLICEKIDHDHGRNPPNSLLNALGSVCPSTPPPKIQRQATHPTHPKPKARAKANVDVDHGRHRHPLILILRVTHVIGALFFIFLFNSRPLINRYTT